MLATLSAPALFLGLLLASFVLWALFLRLGLRWAKVPDVTTRRVVLATVAVFVLQGIASILLHLVQSASDALTLLLALVEVTAAVLIPCLVIKRIFQTRLLRAVQAWLPTLVASAATIAFVLLVFRPFLLESFVAPTNAMAPTLLGHHWRGSCPKCGEPNYGSPLGERYGSEEPPRMICENFHVTQISMMDKTVHAPDRFFVVKFLTPRRWDLIVFQYPEDPSSLYIKRLVGLPGETIHIEDGSVLADGKKLTLPESIRGIEYLSSIPDWHGPELWGTASRPAPLGDDEYFVLGDFSAQSKDSRLWEQGAPGHNPYAIPESYLRGVVTHRFWPLPRLRVLR